jgi:hypothetical protein
MPVPTLVQELKGKRIVDIACSGERISSIYPFFFSIILLVLKILSQRSLKPTFKLKNKFIQTSACLGLPIDDSCYFALSESGVVFSWSDFGNDVSSKTPHFVERLQVIAIVVKFC